MDSHADTAVPMLLNRDQALALLHEHTEGAGLRKHALSVEAAMRAYARKLGGDEELWGATGLLHDFDYEKHPSKEEHPFVGCGILREKGYPPEMIEAILGHASYSGTPRTTPMARALFAVDELCAYLTGTRGREGSLRISFTVTEEQIEVAGVAELGPGQKVRTELTEFSRQILATVVDSAWLERKDGVPTFVLRKRRRA